MNLNYNHFVSLYPDKKICASQLCHVNFLSRSGKLMSMSLVCPPGRLWSVVHSQNNSSTEHNVSNFKLPSFPKLESVSWYIPFCFYIIYLNPETHCGSCKHVRLYSRHAPTLPEHFLKLQNRCTSCQKLWNAVRIIWNQKRQYANNHFIHSLLSWPVCLPSPPHPILTMPSNVGWSQLQPARYLAMASHMRSHWFTLSLTMAQFL